MPGATAGIGAANAEKFGDLLRRLRVEADLTQEALAERAGLSVRAISDLERGVKRAPRFDTMRMLADGLGLSGEARAAFAATARRHAIPPGPRRAPNPEDGIALPLPEVAGSTALPIQPTDLIGRDAELAAIVGLLHGGARLVTLTGPGGVGKTRLSISAAAELLPHVDGNVAVVELAPVRDRSLVASAVAAACRLREEGGGDPEAALVEHLRARRFLLLLDNCEHVLAAAAALAARVIAGCPEVRVLATSRSRLGLRGEREIPLAPLALPADAEAAGAALAGNPAVRLFVERAREADPSFRLSDRNAAAVADIVRRLDGLPLAIELAAARSRILPPAGLLARLDRRLPLLTGGPRDLPARQQTLGDAIAWSYDLLQPEQQALYRRLSVFTGGFTLDAADAISRANGPGDAGGSVEDAGFLESVLDGVDALAAASLLRRDDPAAETDAEREPRFRMLETIREFGLERLTAEGEEADVRARHAAWCWSLAERAEPALFGPEQGRWLDRLAEEHDNLRSALAWSLGGADPPLGLRLASSLSRFWWVRGHLSEGRSWLERAIEHAPSSDDRMTAKVLRGIATLAMAQGDLDHAAVRAEAALARYVTVSDQLGEANALADLGTIANYRGDRERAEAHLERALALYRALDVRVGVPDVLNDLGNLAFLSGDFARAASYYEESLERCRQLGNDQAVVTSLVNLGDAARRGGDVERAERLFMEALVRARGLGDQLGTASATAGLGQVARLRGEYERAAKRLAEALLLFRAADDVFGTAECLEGLAGCSLTSGDPETAALLLSAAEVSREIIGAPLPPPLRTVVREDIERARGSVDSEALALAWTSGRVRPIDEIATEAATRFA